MRNRRAGLMVAVLGLLALAVHRPFGDVKISTIDNPKATAVEVKAAVEVEIQLFATSILLTWGKRLIG